MAQGLLSQKPNQTGTQSTDTNKEKSLTCLSELESLNNVTNIICKKILHNNRNALQIRKLTDANPKTN